MTSDPSSPSAPIAGTLFIRRVGLAPAGALREEALRFATLQELLDLCVKHAADAAFVRVQVVGSSAGHERRLVLDFGQFGLFTE